MQEGRNGFTFDPYDAEAIARTLMQVWQMEDGELSRLGEESARLIGHWGTERFATGLKAAAEKAIEVGPVKPTLFQRALLQALIHC